MKQTQVKLKDLVGKLLSLKHSGKRYTGTLVRFDKLYLEISEKNTDYVTLVLPIKSTEIIVLGMNADEFYIEQLIDWEDAVDQLRLQGKYIHGLQTELIQ
jgi:hypothetical protein